MQRNWLNWLFTFEGRVGCKEYLIAGISLAALKYAIDWSILGHFGTQLYLWSYDIPMLSRATPLAPASKSSSLLLILWAITIPFFWTGISLTTRRVRDAGIHPACVCLFFIPVVKFALFAVLIFSPSTPVREESGMKIDEPGTVREWGVLGVVVASGIGLVLIAFGTRFLMSYSWGLFLGVPFLAGFVASWFLNAKSIQSVSRTVAVSSATVALIGAALLGFAFEGLICLLMALPLALPFAIAGGLVARNILRGDRPQAAPRAFTACITLLPAMMFTEHAAKLEPPVLPVTTSIVISAPASVVWKNVIQFPPLAPPQELIFRAGIAYPTSGKIVGTGSGAVRYCRFSTGDFVEPITTWDEDHLLAFNVAAQPPSLHELSPWNVVPPHIELNYMRSQHGQFRLVALNDHSTLLEGTTWYQNYFWPQVYWREWSDAIVHRIHTRVLEHVKQQAELSYKRDLK